MQYIKWLRINCFCCAFNQIYKNVLEKQENFNRFSDFIETYPLTRGKAEDDEEPEFAGEFKVKHVAHTVLG